MKHDRFMSGFICYSLLVRLKKIAGGFNYGNEILSGMWNANGRNR